MIINPILKDFYLHRFANSKYASEIDPLFEQINSLDFPDSFRDYLLKIYGVYDIYILFFLKQRHILECLGFPDYVWESIERIKGLYGPNWDLAKRLYKYELDPIMALHNTCLRCIPPRSHFIRAKNMNDDFVYGYTFNLPGSSSESDLFLIRALNIGENYILEADIICSFRFASPDVQKISLQELQISILMQS